MLAFPLAPSSSSPDALPFFYAQTNNCTSLEHEPAARKKCLLPLHVLLSHPVPHATTSRPFGLPSKYEQPVLLSQFVCESRIERQVLPHPDRGDANGHRRPDLSTSEFVVEAQRHRLNWCLSRLHDVACL